MVTKNAQYQIKDGSLFSIYHYETNSGQVKILDKNKVELGTLQEFMFGGKVVESGAVKDLKVSGLYKVKGLSGLPEEIPSDKIALLSARAVGEINNPDFVNYQIISQNGDIFNKTIVGSIESPWSSGGTKLENTINTLISNFGSLSNLTTTAKGSLVNAINEVDDRSKTTEQNLSELKISYEEHNHDARYIKKSGDTISGNINIPTTYGFSSLLSGGETRNMVRTSSSGDIELGNEQSILNLYSRNDLLHNGNKVWTEVSDGSGSGLDADLLDGLHGSDYAKSTVSNIFEQENLFKEDIKLDKGIAWDGGKVYFDSNGDFNISRTSLQNPVYNVRINKYNELYAGGLYMKDGNGSENRVVWDVNGDMMGFLRNRTYGGGEIWMYNWAKNGGGRIFYVSPSNNTINFDRDISISGRRLYMQSNQPSGSIPDGSIWIM